MRPATFNLVFELGAVGAADFSVSPTLPITQAKVSFRKDRGATVTFTVNCVILANVAQLRLSVAEVAQLGIGKHAYQLDVISVGEPYRIAKGEVGVNFGTETVF